MNATTLHNHLAAGAIALRLPITAEQVGELTKYVTDQTAAEKERAAAVPPTRVLSPQRYAILVALARGESVQDTARRLVLSPYTVKSHRLRLYAQLDVSTAAEAVAVATQRGLLRLPLGETA